MNTTEEKAKEVAGRKNFGADRALVTTPQPCVMIATWDKDRAVMQAYGFVPGKTSESECVARLFEMYQDLTK